MEAKTVFEWLKELPEPYAEKAIANTQIDKASEMKTNLIFALSSAFYWRDSPQGFDYWEKIYLELLTAP